MRNIYRLVNVNSFHKYAFLCQKHIIHLQNFHLRHFIQWAKTKTKNKNKHDKKHMPANPKTIRNMHSSKNKEKEKHIQFEIFIHRFKQKRTVFMCNITTSPLQISTT